MDSSEENQNTGSTCNAFTEILADVEGDYKAIEWSPKMDVALVVYSNGSVALHRLHWKKYWLIPPLEDNNECHSEVLGVTWRADGRVFAVAYSQNVVKIYHVESIEPVFSFATSSRVSFIKWFDKNPCPDTTSGLANKNQSANGDSDDVDNEDKVQGTKFTDKTDDIGNYFSKLPEFKEYESTLQYQDNMHVDDYKKMNVLIVTYGSFIELRVFGCYSVWKAELKAECDTTTTPQRQITFTVNSACINNDFTSVQALATGTVVTAASAPDDAGVTTLCNVCRKYKIAKIFEDDVAILFIASTFCKIYSLLHYWNIGLKRIVKTWEDILNEMHSKLEKFSKQKYESGGSSVSNDLIRYIVFGIASDELTIFLLHDLTEKGMLKLGTYVEDHYKLISSMCTNHLTKCSQMIYYHTVNLKCCSQLGDLFHVTDASLKVTQELARNAGDVILKMSELRNVINDNIEKLTVFFRWLYVVIRRLSDEKDDEENPEVRQFVMSELIDFINENLSDNLQEPSKDNKTFKLEKVGQYLRDENLAIKCYNGDETWRSVLDSLKLNDEPRTNIFNSDVNGKSLIQVINSFTKSLTLLMKTNGDCLGETTKFENFLGLSLPENEDHDCQDSEISECKQLSIDKDCLMNFMFVARSPSSSPSRSPSSSPATLMYVTKSTRSSSEKIYSKHRQDIILRLKVSKIPIENNDYCNQAFGFKQVAEYDNKHVLLLLQPLMDCPNSAPFVVVLKLPLQPLHDAQWVQVSNKKLVHTLDLQTLSSCELLCRKFLVSSRDIPLYLSASGIRRVGSLLRIGVNLDAFHVDDGMDSDSDEDEDEDDDGDVGAAGDHLTSNNFNNAYGRNEPVYAVNDSCETVGENRFDVSKTAKMTGAAADESHDCRDEEQQSSAVDSAADAAHEPIDYASRRRARSPRLPGGATCVLDLVAVGRGSLLSGREYRRGCGESRATVDHGSLYTDDSQDAGDSSCSEGICQGSGGGRSSGELVAMANDGMDSEVSDQVERLCIDDKEKRKKKKFGGSSSKRQQCNRKDEKSDDYENANEFLKMKDLSAQLEDIS